MATQQVNMTHPEFAAFNVLIERCDSQKPAKSSDIKALKEYLQKNPTLWRYAGDMAHNCRLNILQTNNFAPAIQASIEIGLKEMEKDLGYELASPLEGLLIEQILNCWLDHYLTEFKHESLTKDCSFEQADHWERRVNSSQRRYLRAIEALARVQKLLRPVPNPVQVNIADKQVNISKGKD